MVHDQGVPGRYGLENHGLRNLKNTYWNLSAPTLVEEIIHRGEGTLAQMGAVVVNTGQHTGRAPNDKFIVQNPNAIDDPIWWGKVNKPISSEQFDRLYQKVTSYLQGRDVFVKDMLAGAHPEHQLPIRVITESAWHTLFAHDLFLRLPIEKASEQKPEFTIVHAPGFQANPAEDGTASNVFVIINFEKRIILIGGTGYAGEVKKSVFTILNYLLPRMGILSMHCSANVGAQGDVALFFGLSGTGKTTLSSDPERRLIGDDEHGWCDDGVFNFEGGCYAKTIHLRKEFEPLIWEATRRFGTVLENVIIDPLTRQIDFDDDRLTENTRAAYPIDFVPNHVPEGYAGHPENVFFLTADAFGVMPPLAQLSTEQAMFYFLSGYTSKLAGTEKGLGAEPQATFSTCFGAPFLPLHPRVYAEILGEKIVRHNAKVWLVNTGWTGGPFGIGKRIHLPYTRAMVRAALTHQLDTVPLRVDPIFGLSIPTTCPEVPADVLDPRKTWADPEAYDRQARTLVASFEKNFEQFRQEVSPDVVSAGPMAC
ncbi:MAG TPA: phosphoenolpyruvate carboxykinase (ATP) [Anaerolineaceae bacterium]|nr:phosphoenolpyruvate carboxykinase (ATP) [Anaerolineaceae bacterium]